MRYDGISTPGREFVWIKVKYSEILILEFLWRPPWVWNLLDEILCTKKDFFLELVDSWLSSHSYWDVQHTRVSYHEKIGGRSLLLEFFWNGVHILFIWNDVKKINSANHSSSLISLWEIWNILTGRFVKLFISLLKTINLLLCRLFGGCMNPEWPSILVSPLSSLKSFEAADKERSPWLMHWENHSNVIWLLEKGLIYGYIRLR